MKKILAFVMMLMISMMLTACGSSSVSSSSDKNIVSDPGALTKAMDELQNNKVFKGKDVYIFQDVVVGWNKDIGNFIFLDVVQPGTENVDHYEYTKGQWGAPSAVKITGEGNMADNIILMKDLHFDKLSDIYKTMQDKVKDKKDVKVKTQATYRFWRGNWTVLIDAESELEEYNGEFKPDGTLIEFKKH